jgi:hypothetical protein
VGHTTNLDFCIAEEIIPDRDVEPLLSTIKYRR